MIRIEIEGFHDLIKFIKLIKSDDLDVKLKSFTDELNTDADKLIQAEKTAKEGK